MVIEHLQVLHLLLRALVALFGSGITSKKLRRSSLETGGERFPSL